MASHAPQTILYPTNEGLVMTSGYSARLAKGQFGIVDKGANPSALGQAVVNVFPTTPKDRLFELRLGTSDLTVNRSQTNKGYSSMPFKLSEVVDISVSAPLIGAKVDKMIIGYDGINEDTAIVMANGDNEIIDITLSGEAIGMLGYAHSKVTVQLFLTAPNEGEFTMHEIIEEGVKRLKEIKLKGGVPITEYIDIQPVNSENTTTVSGVDYTFFSLVLPDSGRHSDLGKVQAQYPLFDVKQDLYSGGSSTYVILAPSGTVLADYTATSVAIADANCDGEPETVETDITYEWVEGDTCTAIAKNFTIQLADDICGQDKLAALQAMYPNLNILIDTPTQTRTVNLAGTTGTGNIRVGGVNYLSTFNTDLATTEQNFVTAHAAAILLATGATVTYAGGLITFTAPSGEMPSISFTNLTGNLAGTIGTLTGTGTAVTGVACQTVYRTQVFSDIVCEECSPLLRDLFIAEAPFPFEMIYWVEETPVYSDDALMGIYLEGLPNIMAGSEEYRDDIPFIYSSTRISVANIAPSAVNESFNMGTNGRFKVKLLEIAADPSGLGKDLFDLEERTRVYMTGAKRHAGNNYARLVLGEESMLKPLSQYVLYSIKLKTDRFAQSWSGEVRENFNFLIAAEVGFNSNVETLVNALATAAGLPTVSAY